MVFFSCEGCNETLKKSQVENHLRRASCSQYPVSCVDCSQVFPGHSYAAHTSCISEAEKYEKTLYKGPKNGKGGLKKRDPQAEWMEMISTAVAEGTGTTAAMRAQLPRMAELGNVPRNEKKFKNFLSNSLRINRPQEQDELWAFLKGKSDAARAEADNAKKAEEEAAAAANSNKKQEKEEVQDKAAGDDKKDNKKKKRKEVDEAQEEQQPSTPVSLKKKQKMDKQEEGEEEAGSSSFPWAKTIKKMVKKAEEKQLSRKALQKQVLALAMEEARGEEKDNKKALKRKFKAVLEAGVSGVKVEGDVVLYSGSK